MFKIIKIETSACVKTQDYGTDLDLFCPHLMSHNYYIELKKH